MVPAALPLTPDNRNPTTRSSNTGLLPVSRPPQLQQSNLYPAAIFSTTSSNLLFFYWFMFTYVSMYNFCVIVPRPPFSTLSTSQHRLPPTTSFTHITLFALPFCTCFLLNWWRPLAEIYFERILWHPRACSDTNFENRPKKEKETSW